PGARAALARLAHSDLAVVIITNQAVINRGLVSVEAVEDIHRRMTRAIQVAGGRVDGVLYCPHRPDEGCGCRKPQPGLLLQAARELDVDLSRSYIIGDAWSDMQAGQAVGCQCYLVLTGRGRRQFLECVRKGYSGFRLAWNLGDAIRMILMQERVSDRLPRKMSPSLTGGVSR
ncbi:MAG: HAD-IIIA family hydrolase, partial [Anaerolineae bacterium]|nr:HAD-IIIA family hydrolase [Anaerolineae bacterium]